MGQLSAEGPTPWTRPHLPPTPPGAGWGAGRQAHNTPFPLRGKAGMRAQNQFLGRRQLCRPRCRPVLSGSWAQACFLRGSLCAPCLRARIPPRPRDRPAPGPSELGVWLPCLRAAGDPRGQHLGAVGLDQVTRWPRKPTSRLSSATRMLSPQAFSAVLMESEKWGWKFGKSTVIFLKCLLKSSEV